MFGPADLDQNGIVSVDELYQYVYVKSRFQTINYPAAQQQIPEFSSQLYGKGALAISFPGQTTTTITFAENIEGDVILSQNPGLQIYRFFKDNRADYSISVPAGHYDVTVRHANSKASHRLDVLPATPVRLSFNDFQWHTGERHGVLAAKGDLTEPPVISDLDLTLGTGMATGLFPRDKIGPLVVFDITQPLLRATSINAGWFLSIAASRHQSQIQSSDGTIEEAADTNIFSYDAGIFDRMIFSDKNDVDLGISIGRAHVRQDVRETSHLSEGEYAATFTEIGAKASWNFRLRRSYVLGPLLYYRLMNARSADDGAPTRLSYKLVALKVGLFF